MSKKLKILHLVDHIGTISELIKPLEKYDEHEVLLSNSSAGNLLEYIFKYFKSKDTILVLHITGNKNKTFYLKKEELIKNYKNFYFFVHVSPSHFLIKNRLDELYKIKTLCTENNLEILVPSKILKKKFEYYGFISKFIQIGIDFPYEKNYLIPKNNKKIITISTSDKYSYAYIKGIDEFYDIINYLNLIDKSIVYGNGVKIFSDLKTEKLSKNSFLEELSKSKMYVQLSRTESYNITAIYAKRLKIPVVLSNIEGHRDNTKYGYLVNSEKEAKDIIEKIYYNKEDIDEIIEKNYLDSIKRESLENFKESFNKILK